MPKCKVKVYPTNVMSEIEIDAPTEAQAIAMAEQAAAQGKLKFWKPDRPFVSLIYKEPKLRAKAPPVRSEGELLEGGQDDGS